MKALFTIIIGIIAFCSFFLFGYSVFKASTMEKPLTEYIFENPNIHSIKIYKDSIAGKAYYSINFDDSVGYDYLEEDSLKMVIITFPKRIYNIKKE